MIEVRTCARLHLGLLDNNGEQGRLYGSIGLAVNHPHLVLTAEPANGLHIEGLEAERITTYAQGFMDVYGQPKGAKLHLVTCIPAHVGLGSGTQLGLAVGMAMARLAGLPVGVPEIARAVGRGVHSGIGIATFQHGGFVLDGGHRLLLTSSVGDKQSRQIEKGSVPPLLFRHPMPKNWFFVMIIPETGPGFSGAKEQSAFLQLPIAPSSVVEKISWVLLMKMLPALVEEDIANFGQALTSIQNMVGDCFASVQGGRFATPVLEKLVGFLLEKGALGAGQSSWGPTVYGLVDGESRARKLAGEVRDYLVGFGGGSIFCVQAQNRGAQVRTI
ncbi:MAG: kinase [Acidobacteria bacterium]|nr:kinase [Acidobacteriota bacterium]